MLTLVGFFSSTESEFKCTGEFEKNNDLASASLSMRLTKYRWWVHLWNDSDGILKVTAPGLSAEMFYYLIEQDGEIQIWSEKGKPKSGQYSIEKRQINLYTFTGNFRGFCQAIENH